MVDKELLDKLYELPERKAIGEAFQILHQLGVFKHQAKENASRITEGFNDANPDELVKLVMQVQQTNRNLLALHELAGTYNKEQQT